MHLAYLWLCKTSPSAARSQTGHSKQTICDYFSYFRQLVASFPSIEEQIIGGKEVIVEIDESKMGKRKYHRGHPVEGVWLLGGVERTVERRTFFVPVEDRSAQTLLPLIARHVLPGSIIYTDLWKSYRRIEEELNLLHFTVNHSEAFVDPISGVHTNTIEGTWRGLKICIAARNRVRNGIETYIAEFQWMRQHKNNKWETFLSALRDTHYD
jgi:transposase-like protein